MNKSQPLTIIYCSVNNQPFKNYSDKFPNSTWVTDKLNDHVPSYVASKKLTTSSASVAGYLKNEDYIKFKAKQDILPYIGTSFID